MDSIKFNHNGKEYTLTASSNRVTTPSIILDGKTYIPLFKGEIGSTVVVDDNVYILSPFKVDNDLRAPSEVISTKCTASVMFSYHFDSKTEKKSGDYAKTTSYYYAGIIGASCSNSRLGIALTDLEGLNWGESLIDTHDSGWQYKTVPSPNWCTKTLTVSGEYTLTYYGTPVKQGKFTTSATVNFDSIDSKMKTVIIQVE